MDDGSTGTRPDAVELLTSHHRDVEQLWTRARRARASDDVDLAAELGQRVITLLSQHDAIETQYLYPALREVGETGDGLADRSLEAHQQVRELLKAADGSLHDPEGWTALTRALEEVEQHAAEEEGRIFPMLRTVGAEELHELGEAMQVAWKTAPTHPHPTTPNNPIGAAVMGTAAGIVDRVRDALKRAS